MRERKNKMNIAELLTKPVGFEYKDGAGFAVTVKTVKKSWPDALGDKIQQFLLTDATGEAIADVMLLKTDYGPDHINRGSQLRITAFVLQPTAGGARCFVTEYEQPVSIGEPPPLPDYREQQAPVQKRTEPNWDLIAIGKVRHGVVCAYLQGGQEPNVSDVLYWTRFIMTGTPEAREE
jgi:hypothetical protein